MQAGTRADTRNTTTSEGKVLSRGLGARARESKSNVSEGQIQPGRPYIPDMVMVSYSPGHVLHCQTSYAGLPIA